MKFVNIVSERDFDQLVPDISDEARASLWEMWRDDLSTKMQPIELVRNANAMLKYYGSEVLVTDVQWDDESACFLWEQFAS